MSAVIGSVIGGMLVIYLLSKLLEWVLLKRIMRSYCSMIYLSSAVVFSTICIAWYIKRNEVYAFQPALLVAYFMAALILPYIRRFFYKRKAKKLLEAASSTQV